MDVQERVQSLYREGQREEAVSLARASLQNDEVTGVVLGEDAVRVETTNFVGTQTVAEWDGGEVVLGDDGRYQLRDDDAIEFSTHTVYDNVFDAIDAADDGDGPSESAPVDEDEEPQDGLA